MDFEALIFSWIVGAALLPVAIIFGRHCRPFRKPIFAIWLLLSVGSAWLAREYRNPAVPPHEITHRPTEISSDGYVSSDSCRACHPREYATWHSSYHHTMTQLATPASVTGNFDGQTITLYGRSYHLERRGNEFWAEFDVPSPNHFEDLPAPRIRRRIEMITGSHNMQVYWYSTGHQRRLGMLPIVFLHEAQRWVPRLSAFLEPPDGHSDETGHWNRGCIVCHTTHGDPRAVGLFDFDSRVAEFGIACESCHGPAEDHVATYQDPVHRFTARQSDRSDPSVTNPARIDPRRATETCGQCHRNGAPKTLNHGLAYRPGDRLADFMTLGERGKFGSTREGKFQDSAFWPDGVVRVAGREYNGLVKTPCYNHGKATNVMSCLSCHVSHQQTGDGRPVSEWADDQLAVGMRSNQACTQCHTELTEPATLQKHTRHETASGGSLCYNCHMSHTSYGLLKAVRSHTVDSPDTATALASGRINACNQCHIDKPLTWTAEHLQDWYGIEPPTLDEEQHQLSPVVFQALSGDAGQRALMAWSLGWRDAHAAAGNDWIAPYLAQLLDDPYDAVRYIAYRSLRRLPGFEAFEYDFIGTPAERNANSIRARKIWNDQPKPWKTEHPEILVNRSGIVDQSKFNELLNQRDNRPVIIAE
jgi:hypothetical protein